MSARSHIGSCKLLNVRRPRVKSHIIPQAFTRRVFPKFPFMEMDGEIRPKRQWSSWYDGELVCDEAEKLFAKWDSYAAKVLADNGLTFRSGKQRILDPHKFIEIDGTHVEQIRLFGLSLLWRAAATKLEAFRDVELIPSNLEILRRMLVNEDAGACTDFPMLLIAHSDGIECAPIGPMSVSNLQGVPFFRFFLDGVVAYIGKEPASKSASRFGKWLVGSDPALLLYTMPYEGSWQDRATHAAALDTMSGWGDPWRNIR